MGRPSRNIVLMHRPGTSRDAAVPVPADAIQARRDQGWIAVNPEESIITALVRRGDGFETVPMSYASFDRLSNQFPDRYYVGGHEAAARQLTNEFAEGRARATDVSVDPSLAPEMLARGAINFVANPLGDQVSERFGLRALLPEDEVQWNDRMAAANPGHYLGGEILATIATLGLGGIGAVGRGAGGGIARLLGGGGTAGLSMNLARAARNSALRRVGVQSVDDLSMGARFGVEMATEAAAEAPWLGRGIADNLLAEEDDPHLSGEMLAATSGASLLLGLGMSSLTPALLSAGGRVAERGFRRTRSVLNSRGLDADAVLRQQAEARVAVNEGTRSTAELHEELRRAYDQMEAEGLGDTDMARRLRELRRAQSIPDEMSRIQATAAIMGGHGRTSEDFRFMSVRENAVLAVEAPENIAAASVEVARNWDDMSAAGRELLEDLQDDSYIREFRGEFRTMAQDPDAFTRINNMYDEVISAADGALAEAGHTLSADVSSTLQSVRDDMARAIREAADRLGGSVPATGRMADIRAVRAARAELAQRLHSMRPDDPAFAETLRELREMPSTPTTMSAEQIEDAFKRGIAYRRKLRRTRESLRGITVQDKRALKQVVDALTKGMHGVESAEGRASTVWTNNIATRQHARDHHLSRLRTLQDNIEDIIAAGDPTGELAKSGNAKKIESLGMNLGKNDRDDATMLALQRQIEEYDRRLHQVISDVSGAPSPATRERLVSLRQRRESMRRELDRLREYSVAQMHLNRGLKKENHASGMNSSLGLQNQLPNFASAVGLGSLFGGLPGAAFAGISQLALTYLTRPVSWYARKGSLYSWLGGFKEKHAVAVSQMRQTFRQSALPGLSGPLQLSPITARVGVKAVVHNSAEYAKDVELRAAELADIRDELDELMASPELLEENLMASTQKIAGVDAIAHQSLQMAGIRALHYLHSTVPRPPQDPMTGEDLFPPSTTEMEAFFQVVEGLEDPLSAFGDLAAGTLSFEKADAIRTVYPELHGAMVADVSEIMSDTIAEYGDISPTLKQHVGTLLGTTTSYEISPAFIAAMQNYGAQTTAQDAALNARTGAGRTGPTLAPSRLTASQAVERID